MFTDNSVISLDSIVVAYLRVVHHNGYKGLDKICLCLRGQMQFTCLCHNKRGQICWKGICDLVYFGNVRYIYILYHLKINISIAVITPTSPFCHDALTTVQLVIISGEYWMKAILWTNSEIPTCISVVTILIQLPSMSFSSLLWELDVVYVFHY